MSLRNSFTILDLHFDDFEAFAEAARGWHLDFRQLDRGPFRGALTQVETGPVLLTRARFNRRFAQRGRALPGRRTFAVLEEGAGPVVWCGRDFGKNGVAIFRRDGEFEAISAPGFEVYTLAIDERYLTNLMGRMGLDEPDQDGRLLAVDRVYMQQELRGRLQRILEAANRIGSQGGFPDLRMELENELPEAILGGISFEKKEPPPRSSYIRARARKTACAYIEDRKHEPLVVSDLCQVAGVSERTLQYAFRERFGVSPKAYLKAVRFHEVRKALREADPASTLVADVANRWGFWHAGQFAADYRKTFGELPLQTLSRRRLWPAS